MGDADASQGAPGTRLNLWQWLSFGPWLAQLVVTRRCNLSCGYCTEFDSVSAPVPFDELIRRLEKLAALRTWAVCLTGGEPTLHPRLHELVGLMRSLGFRRRQMITNGTRLDRALVARLNEAGLTDMQISVDGVTPNAVTSKCLAPLRSRLEMLAREARFQVVLSAVVGSAPPAEVLEVVTFAKEHGFTPRILLLHDERGQVKLSAEELALYREAKRRIGSAAREAHDYREGLIASGRSPFRCRSGSRYLYVDEHGRVNWCAQTRGAFSKDLLAYTLADLRAQFHAPKSCNELCTIGCARTASAVDAWRGQDGAPAAAPAAPEAAAAP